MAIVVTLGLNERLTGYHENANGTIVTNIEYAFSQIQQTDNIQDEIVLVQLLGKIAEYKELSTHTDNGITQLGDVVLVPLPVTDDNGNTIGGRLIVSYNDWSTPSNTTPYTPRQETIDTTTYQRALYYSKVLAPFAYPETPPDFTQVTGSFTTTNGGDNGIISFGQEVQQLFEYIGYLAECAFSSVALVLTFLFDTVTLAWDVVYWAFWLIGL